MWKKVISKEQLEGLQIGDALVKYPIKGAIEESFDGATPDNISPRVVSDNTGGSIRLSFLYSDRQNDPVLGMYKSVFGPVEMSYEELIAKRNWWVFEG